jgi:YidC/Oxa1 family membrane protein insertase
LDNQQGRLVLFIIASVLILGLSSYFMPSSSPTDNSASSSQTQTATLPSGSLSSSPVKTSQLESHLPAVAEKFASVPVTQITIETDDYLATFSNRGGNLTSFKLKKYLDRSTNKPIDLVNPDATMLQPFSLEYSPLPDVNQAVFEVQGDSQKLSKSNDNARLVFHLVASNGMALNKIFTFKNGSYLIGFDVTVSQLGHQAIQASSLVVNWSSTLGLEENTGTNSRTGGYRVATLVGDRIISDKPQKAQETNEIPPPVSWTALANQYFVAALIPDPASGGASAKVVRDTNAFRSPTDENPNPGIDPKVFAPRPELIFSTPALNNGESFERKGQVFLGPQDYNLMKNLNLQLEHVVDFGTFGFISVYMLALLKWFYTVSHNWGLAIILLSVVVKLALWFPTHNSYKNMYVTQQKMRELQPKMDAIKRKYADLRQKHADLTKYPGEQQEIGQLYQAAGVNPLGGCLPMLLQLPIFWALYATLGHSIELYHAPFLWVGDLTLKDPYHVLPLLMGGTMIVQQRVSGQMATQAAGQQKVMMWMMPVVLTFISFQWPSGLLVYWVVTNLLSMIQQKVVNLEIQKAKKKDEVSKQ